MIEKNEIWRCVGRGLKTYFYRVVKPFVRSRDLFNNTVVMSSGSFIRLGIQAVYFVLIARALGAEGYGVFLSASALVGIFAPFASWGTGNLLIRNVAQTSARFSESWGSGVATILSFATVIGVFLLATFRFVLPAGVTFGLMASIACAELICARLVDLGGQAFQAFERLNRTAQFQVLLSLSRLGGAVLLWLGLFDASPTAWGYLYLLSTGLAASIALITVRRELGWGRLSLRPMKSELREGFYFASGLGSQTLYNDVDKTMLAAMAGFGATGLYGAAYRIVDFAFIPVRSVLFSSYPRFFRFGRGGLGRTVPLALRLMWPCSIYALAAILGLWIFAPALPLILGLEYAPSVSALQWLTPLVLLRVWHYFPADALTGAGGQGVRTGIQFLVGLLNIGLNIRLIPTHGWLGAAWASLASDALLATSMWLTLLVKRSRARVSGK